MRVEPIAPLPPEMERPTNAGAVATAVTAVNLHSNDPETTVAPVGAAEPTAPASKQTQNETVWIENENRAVFRVVERESGEVVCQMPSNEVLRVSRGIEDLIEDSTPSVDLES